MTARTQRVRDPIHDLIVFDEKDEIDQLAWRLINTPEFQRLRRIRQLGVSDLVFPGATHSRFAHSLGVYHNARRLLAIVERIGGSMEGPTEREERAKAVRLAALLHDVGHGPFSHIFEGAREALSTQQGRVGEFLKHERLSALLVRHPQSSIRRILEEHDASLPEKIAELIQAEDPSDIYHAVLSSSFDADRLDYLVRDRYMTGTGSGAVDIEWLLDNLIAEAVPLSTEEEDEQDDGSVLTFAFAEKARAAAEDFLIARYRLYSSVYLHKATRGFEQVVRALICWLGSPGNAAAVGIEPEHPLVRFLTADKENGLEDYARIDDLMVWGLIERLSRCSSKRPRELATRLLHRERARCLDLLSHHQANPTAARGTDDKLRERFAAQLGERVFRDSASINLYKALDGNPAKEHTMIRIRGTTGPLEITRFGDTLISGKIMKDQTMIRYYFLDDDNFETARRIATTGR